MKRETHFVGPNDCFVVSDHRCPIDDFGFFVS